MAPGVIWKTGVRSFDIRVKGLQEWTLHSMDLF
jgi:hypothetical protein